MENTEECCSWLAPGFMVSYFSETDQAHLPKDGIAHSGLGPPTWITNQEKAPQTCSQGNRVEAVPQLRLLLLEYVKLSIDLTEV